MSMVFRQVKSYLVAQLEAEAAGRYQVAGYQKQVISADDVKDALRLVQVFWERTDFPAASYRQSETRTTEATFRIRLITAAGAEIDLVTLNSDASTSAQKKAALLAISNAAARADDSFDELAEIVYQIIEDATRRKLGTSGGIVSNRRLSSIDKDEIEEQGDLVVLTGSAVLTVRLEESITGGTTTPLTTIDLTLTQEGDDVGKAGVEVTHI